MFQFFYKYSWIILLTQQIDQGCRCNTVNLGGYSEGLIQTFPVIPEFDEGYLNRFFRQERRLCFWKNKEIEFFMVLIKYLLKNKAVSILYCSDAVQTGAKIENQVALLRRTSMDNNFLILHISCTESVRYNLYR